MLVTLSTTRSDSLLESGHSTASALTDGYHLAFLIGMSGRELAGRNTAPREGIGPPVPYFLVQIRGNPDRAASLLSKAGIQNAISVADSAGSEVPAGHVPARSVTARVLAESASLAAERVREALKGETFTVGVARPEPGSL